MIEERVVALYPGLARAIKEIAYDNGVINRFHTEEQVIKHALNAVFDMGLWADLTVAERYCRGLSDEALEALCCGESLDAPDPTSPVGITDRILNELFDNLVPVR